MHATAPLRSRNRRLASLYVFIAHHLVSIDEGIGRDHPRQERGHRRGQDVSRRREEVGADDNPTASQGDGHESLLRRVLDLLQVVSIHGESTVRPGP